MLKSAVRSFSVSATRNAFARMQLLGTVGSVNFRETKNGTKFINYSLAVNQYDPSSEDNKTTDWFNVSVFDEKQISAFEKFLRPGAQLFVEADVRQRVLVDEEGENKHTLTSLKQVRFDVVRFPKKLEESEDTEGH
ncbi:ssDNA-binding protein, mitochondrial [Scheffersomyces spartinae]|uniref:Single-stranded DNA-binding protein n=1 Tax=Scheffersomyces spartinae TaxID=45513 RepID=A0A9P7VBU8_9ASCO|nr:ssDNA-binding protein, mitochondrial [Scheffersomyces spartinae]KAG7195158.1 ssDNA-binding protein, mitochondrial [Scheffersomyces spartinae]